MLTSLFTFFFAANTIFDIVKWPIVLRWKNNRDALAGMQLRDREPTKLPLIDAFLENNKGDPGTDLKAKAKLLAVQKFVLFSRWFVQTEAYELLLIGYTTPNSPLRKKLRKHDVVEEKELVLW